MTKLTPAMRAALEKAKREDGLRRVHNPTLPGKPAWPANASTLAALVRHYLVTRTDDSNRNGWPRTTWAITAAGREALEPPEVHRDQRDEYVMRGPTPVDYEWASTTTIAGDHVRRRAPLAKVRPDTLDPKWAADAATRHADAQDRKDRARRLARNVRRAA